MYSVCWSSSFPHVSGHWLVPAPPTLPLASCVSPSYMFVWQCLFRDAYFIHPYRMFCPIPPERINLLTKSICAKLSLFSFCTLSILDSPLSLLRNHFSTTWILCRSFSVKIQASYPYKRADCENNLIEHSLQNLFESSNFQSAKVSWRSRVVFAFC